MPRSTTKPLAFPLAGVSRRGTYRQQTRPYSAPWAVNVRTFGPSESRKRGGSRPGLAKLCQTDFGTALQALVPISYVDSSGTRQMDLVYAEDDGTVGYIRAGVATATAAEVEDSDGVDILDSNGATILYASAVSSGTALNTCVRGGKVYFADSTLRAYSPATGVVETIAATAGTVPTAETVIACYHDRIFLAGKTQAWYASRMDDPTDWNDGADWEDPGRAVAGQLSLAGKIGDTVTAMVSIQDEALVMATESTLWVLRGEPTIGTLELVSDEVGIIAARAWALSPDGQLAFLSNDGVYIWNPATRGAPTRFSEERIPDELREVASTNTISMCYDPVERGYHLFITPAIPAVGTHWWVDPENKAFWPQRLVASHQPVAAAALLPEGGLGDVVIGSRDGYVRRFVDGQVDDDGEDMESHVLIGPVRMSVNDVKDGLLAEMHAVFDGVTASGTITWRVVTGDTAERAAELAKADLDLVLDGQATVSVARSGTWADGHNKVVRPRARGPWVVLWLSSTSAWSYETVSLVARQLGRHR